MGAVQWLAARQPSERESRGSHRLLTRLGAGDG